MRVLVVEDEEDLVEALKYGLSRADYAVDVAVDLGQASEKLYAAAYDLMILDLALPDRAARGVPGGAAAAPHPEGVRGAALPDEPPGAGRVVRGPAGARLGRARRPVHQHRPRHRRHAGRLDARPAGHRVRGPAAAHRRRLARAAQPPGDHPRRGGWQWIAVQDSGPGLGPDEQARVFDRFWRGPEARRSRERRTGLGLAIVRHIVEAHGGRVRPFSAPGVGSTFVLWFPVAAAGGAGTGAAPPETDPLGDRPGAGTPG